MKEIWKDVVGYEGRYQVSNIGRVRSLDFYMNNKHGGKTLKKGKVLSPSSKGRYTGVSFCVHREVKFFHVHRLVAIAFIKNTHNKPQVNHINGIRHDNRVENLEWCTASENQRHAIENNLVTIHTCENHSQAKLKNEDVLNIRKLIDCGFKLTDIAERYGVSIGSISNIKHRKNWVDL